MVTQILSRHPWAVRFVAPVLAITGAYLGVTDVAELDVLIELLLGVVAAVAAVWRYVATERRTIPINPKPVVPEGTSSSSVTYVEVLGPNGPRVVAID